MYELPVCKDLPGLAAGHYEGHGDGDHRGHDGDDDGDDAGGTGGIGAGCASGAGRTGGALGAGGTGCAVSASGAGCAGVALGADGATGAVSASGTGRTLGAFRSGAAVGAGGATGTGGASRTGGASGTGRTGGARRADAAHGTGGLGAEVEVRLDLAYFIVVEPFHGVHTGNHEADGAAAGGLHNLERELAAGHGHGGAELVGALHGDDFGVNGRRCAVEHGRAEQYVGRALLRKCREGQGREHGHYCKQGQDSTDFCH